MAEMVPDRLPANTSSGEQEILALMQQLLVDFMFYYEQIISKHYPELNF